jgi:septation ring formation regulator EzrA
MKKKATKPDTFTAREVTVLLEDIRGQFKLFSEKLTAMDDKLDSTMGMVAKNREDFTMLDLKVTGVKGKITDIEEELIKINGKLAKIEDDLRIVKSEFGKRLTALEAK